MMRTLPERSQSEKRIPITFDLDNRRSKILTANRTQGKSPMELLTRKLQWRGKDLKRLIPYTSDPKQNRPLTLFKSDEKLEKIFLSNLRGW